jgi:hypothetical protein
MNRKCNIQKSFYTELRSVNSLALGDCASTRQSFIFTVFEKVVLLTPLGFGSRAALDPQFRSPWIRIGIHILNADPDPLLIIQPEVQKLKYKIIFILLF